MQADQSVLDRIQRRQLEWYGHLLRMDDGRWPEKWTLHGWRRRGRPLQSWKKEVTDFVRRNMEEVMAEEGIFGAWEWVCASQPYGSK